MQNNRVNVDADLVGSKVKTLVENKPEMRLREATWNVSGLHCDCYKRKL